jgi:hypothetical protein
MRHLLNFCQVSIRRSAQKNFQPLNEFHRGVRHIGQVSIPCDVDYPSWLSRAVWSRHEDLS